VVQSSGFFNVATTCHRCGGAGQIIKTPCAACAGRGRIKVKRSIKVKIPAGVDNGSRLRLHGEGEAGDKGGRHGDLYVVLYVRAHEIFERHDNDIYCEVPISFTTAALGGEMDVPTLGGKVHMKIPAGTQSGKIFRLRAKGIAHLHDSGIGDELVKVQVEVPTELSSEESRILREFQKISAKDVGPLSRSFMEKMKKLFR
jgi:molecular chaperone DnaJ